MSKTTDIVKHELVSVNTDALFNKISALIEEGRRYVSTAVNLAEVYTKYKIGEYIVEEEQSGKKRAAYGKQILANLSEKLTKKYGDGWSEEQLKLIRKFYITYSKKVNSDCQIQNSKENTVTDREAKKVNGVYQIQNLPKLIDVATMPRFVLSWSHYLVLMRIKNDEERHFYEIEALKEHWSVRYLQRQYASSLYERLALSRDKDEVLRLSREGMQVSEPDDIIKNPVTLEFLGIKPDATFNEKQLENKIISKIQQFLLEMGKGFLFETRQKCLVFEEEFFYVDLVCYNRLLQCYVLIDLKRNEIQHEDIGQMNLYLNYFKNEVCAEDDNPPIGIVLGSRKDELMMEYATQGIENNLFVSKYQLYLPNKEELQKQLEEDKKASESFFSAGNKMFS